MNADRRAPNLRMMAMILVGGLALTGCNATSGISTHDGTTGSLGIDDFGNQIGAAWPAIPASNTTSIAGDNARPYLQLARENFHGDNFGASEKYFRKAVEIKPDSIPAWAGLAASYDQLGRFDLADRAYEQLVRLGGPEMKARIDNNRGYSYLLRDDYKSAEIYLKKAQSSDPSLAEVDGNLQLLEEVRRS
jgi:Flp pilus assembly protein TadD